MTHRQHATRRRYLDLWRWARERAEDHVIHMAGTPAPTRLFPEGGLDGAAAYSDAELRTFADWLLLARESYADFTADSQISRSETGGSGSGGDVDLRSSAHGLK